MKNRTAWPLLLPLLVLGMISGAHADTSASCQEGTVYVPHHVAYCDGFTCHTVVEEGRCVPQDIVNTRAAKEFTCGGSVCQDSLWGRQDVCCVTKLPNQFTKYSCRREELSCPGNRATVRPRVLINATPSEG